MKPSPTRELARGPDEDSGDHHRGHRCTIACSTITELISTFRPVGDPAQHRPAHQRS
jgi:hypothetical protein